MCLCVHEPTDWQGVKNGSSPNIVHANRSMPSCSPVVSLTIFQLLCVCGGQTSWSLKLQSVPSPIGWTCFSFLFCLTLPLFSVNFNKNCIPLISTSGLQIMKRIDLRNASRSIVTLQLEGNKGRHGQKLQAERERVHHLVVIKQKLMINRQLGGQILQYRNAHLSL